MKLTLLKQSFWSVHDRPTIIIKIAGQPAHFGRGKMQRLMTLILLMAAVLLVACGRDNRVSPNNNVDITGSGNIVSREIDIADFDRVEASLYFNLTIHQGETFGVTLFSDDNFIDFIQVEKLGKTLLFDLDPAYAYNFRQVTLRAEVTMPELAGLDLSVNSHVTLDEFQTAGEFKAEMTGNSSLSGELEADVASFNVNGNATVKLAGSGKQLRLDACGNSLTDLSQFEAEEAAIEASCNSTAVVNVDGNMDVEASQHSHVTYVDRPASGDMMSVQSASIRPKQ
jgi:hypothetical protein